MPTISVVTVTYNAANILPALIESLRAQDDLDFEWVIVDGASTDGTVELIAAIKDLRVVWISEPDFGIYDAMNKAVRMAGGEYYLVAGADDCLERDAIRQFKAAAKTTGADLVTAWIRRQGKIDKGSPALPWLYAMHAYVVEHSVSLLIRKRLHEKFGYYPKRFSIGADMYFIKVACADPSVTVARAAFLSGTFGDAGVSCADKAASYCDYFRVQLETEKYKLLQILLFALKLLYNIPKLLRTAKARSIK